MEFRFPFSQSHSALCRLTLGVSLGSPNRACPSSRDEFGFLQSLFHHAQAVGYSQSWSLEPVPAQASAQDANAEAHYLLHSTQGLVCSYRPEEQMLSCLEFCLDTDCFLGLPSRVEHISTKSFPLGCPCLPGFLRN